MNQPCAAFALDTLPHHLRMVARWFLVVLAVGYSTGLVFVFHTTRMTPVGMQERYRGNQPEDSAAAAAMPPAADSSATVAEQPEMKFEKSYEEMLNITHTHMLAMVSFLIPAACIFAGTRRPSRRLKSLLIAEPFIALLVSFAAMWLMRYVHPAFSYLLAASSGSFALALYAMIILSFRELMAPRSDAPVA